LRVVASDCYPVGTPLAEVVSGTAELHDVGADDLALLELAAWCEQLSPTVGLEPPDTLCLEITGLEAVSKPSHDDHEAGKLYESVKEIGVILVAGDNPAEVLEPADRSFDLPASAISPELASVLSGRLLAILPVRADQFDATARQPRSEVVIVGGQVVEEPARLLRQESTLQERFDQRLFMRTGAGDFGRQG
jgi:hypothetical protein